MLSKNQLLVCSDSFCWVVYFILFQLLYEFFSSFFLIFFFGFSLFFLLPSWVEVSSLDLFLSPLVGSKCAVCTAPSTILATFSSYVTHAYIFFRLQVQIPNLWIWNFSLKPFSFWKFKNLLKIGNSSRLIPLHYPGYQLFLLCHTCSSFSPSSTLPSLSFCWNYLGVQL